MNSTNSSSSNNTPGSQFYMEPFQLTFSSLSLFGVFTNILNIFVFLNKKLKDPSYKYTLALSVNNFLNLLCGVFRIFIGCGQLCSSNRASFYGQLYLLAVDDFLTSALSINATFIEVYLSAQRLLLIMNKPFLHTFSCKIVIPTFAVLSLIIYLPLLLIKNINPVFVQNNQTIEQFTVYSLSLNEFGKTSFGKVLPIVLTLIRVFLAVVVLFTINIFASYKFKIYFTKKNHLIKIAANNKSNFYDFFLFSLYFL